MRRNKKTDSENRNTLNRRRSAGSGDSSPAKRPAVTMLLVLVLATALCFAMAVGLTGCSAADGSGAASPEDAGGAAESSEPAGTVLSETEDTLTVVDQAGREVTVKKDPRSIALSYRVVIRFLLNLGQGDKIVGIGKRDPFTEELEPSLKDAADVGKGMADVEALAELDPDLFIHRASDLQTMEAVSKIGIPVVGIEVETPEEMVTALDLLGKVCGAKEKAAELIDYYNEQIKDARTRTAKLKDEDRPTAIVMGSSIGKVADGSMLQGEMLERAGAVNCAGDLEATELWPTAGTEQIFKWDPDYIFITNSESAVYSAEDILKDPTWSELTAVRKKQVYDMPAKQDSWEFPGVVSVLGIDYMMHVMHPDLMDEATLEKKVDAFYEKAYGKTFDRKTLGY